MFGTGGDETGDVPSFGGGEIVEGANGVSNKDVYGVDISRGSDETAEPSAEGDELSFCASEEKVQEVTEQIAEFLVNFSSSEQCEILGHFLGAGGATMPEREDASETTRSALGSLAVDTDDTALNQVQPHIDEARRFVWNYLKFYSECERDLILANWRRTRDTASLSTSVGSFTPPSLTPPGSVTPTAVTPREFLIARRSRSVTPTPTSRSVTPTGVTPRELLAEVEASPWPS